MALPSESAILEALSRVQDPELHRSLTELEMVRQIEIGDEGVVSVLIALTVPGCPLKAKIEGDITRRAAPGRRRHRCPVAFTHMTEEERAALGARLRGGPPTAAARRASARASRSTTARA